MVTWVLLLFKCLEVSHPGIWSRDIKGRPFDSEGGGGGGLALFGNKYSDLENAGNK